MPAESADFAFLSIWSIVVRCSFLYSQLSLFHSIIGGFTRQKSGPTTIINCTLEASCVIFKAKKLKYFCPCWDMDGLARKSLILGLFLNFSYFRFIHWIIVWLGIGMSMDKFFRIPASNGMSFNFN